MKKVTIFLGIIVALFSISLVVAGVPNFQATEVMPSNGHARVTIPEHAVEVAPGIFNLGTSVNDDGRVVEGFAIVDYKKGFGHKPNHNKGGRPGGDTASNCFSHLAKGAKWKIQESYLVDPTNTAGLDGAFVRDNLVANIQELEDAGAGNVFGDEAVGVVQTSTIGNSANGQNEVVFGSISSPGAIAVTYVWGFFSGPPSARELVEWDQVYNQVDFTWNNDGNPNDMDFENIAQHELGHSFGLGHPRDDCIDETMYRFASEGEIKKRDLNIGDIAGINKLYA